MQPYDHRHFEFQRYSGLPRNTFHDPDRLGHIAVGVVCTAIATVLLVLAAIGAFA